MSRLFLLAYFTINFSVFSGFLTEKSVSKYQICFDDVTNQLQIRTSAFCKDPVAKTHFRNEINKTGWSYLEIETSPNYKDEVQAYSAGLAEAQATRQLIKYHWLNTVAGYCKNVEDYCSRLNTYVEQNLNWTRQQIVDNPYDPYWRQVNLMLIQLAGLEDGYYGKIKKPHSNVSSNSFILFQMSGDLEDLEQALNKSIDKRGTLFGSDSCSALIMPLPGNTDILFSHVTWSAYQTMLRVQKLYKLPYTLRGKSDERVPSSAISFSSYPGTLLSIDDFYITETGLAITETTNGNSNASLLKFIRPQKSVIFWIRVMAANRLARTASEWVDIFVKYNSGTYNNQFMVLDYKKFVPGQPLAKSGLFYVVEQAPGFTKSEDMSWFLAKQGHWPSYNVPYFPEIFNISGDLDDVKKYGDFFSYDKSPRALIFARDWQKVTDLETMASLMRYNNYKNDPLSSCKCNPPFSAENAISARNDLNPSNGTFPFKQLGHRCHGGTDLKITNYQMALKLQFYGVSGPTFGDLAPFRWSETDYDLKVPHFGHPDLFAFKPVINKWRYF